MKMIVEKENNKTKNKMILPAMLSIDEEYPISFDLDLSDSIKFFKDLKSSKKK